MQVPFTMLHVSSVSSNVKLFYACWKKRNTFQNKTVFITDSEGTVDVLCDVSVDTTRVCLAVEDEGGSDYINASYIDVSI